VTNFINNITVIKYHGSFQVTKTQSVVACPGFCTTVTAMAQATLVPPSGYDEETQAAPDHSDSVTDPNRYCNATTSFQIQIAAVPTNNHTLPPSASHTELPTLSPTNTANVIRCCDADLIETQYIQLVGSHGPTSVSNLVLLLLQRFPRHTKLFSTLLTVFFAPRASIRFKTQTFLREGQM
jgi:hypothetical protein